MHKIRALLTFNLFYLDTNNKIEIYISFEK